MKHIESNKIVLLIPTLVSIILLGSGSQLTRVSFGEVSISEVVTFFCAIYFFLFITILSMRFMRHNGIKAFFRLSSITIYALPIFLFLIYTAVSLLVTPSTQGIQNLLAMCLFGLGIVFFSITANYELRNQAIVLVAIVLLLFASVSTISFFLDSRYIDPRSFAMTAVVGLAAIVPFSNRHFFYKVAAVVAFVAVLTSASRIATLAAVVTMGFVGLNLKNSKFKNFISVFLWYSLASASTILAYALIPRTSDRGISGDQGLVFQIPSSSVNTQGSLTSIEPPIVINTNGRIHAWTEFLKTVDSPLDVVFGQGTGSSATYGQAKLPFFPQVLNEYLRVYLDNGVAGLLLFGVVVIALTIAIYNPSSAIGEFQIAGLLVLFSSLIVAATDGQFIYPFTALTSGFIIGLSLVERAKPFQQGKLT